MATGAVLGRPALPGPSTGAAFAPDGRRAYVAAGTQVGAVDVAAVPAPPAPGLAATAPPLPAFAFAEAGAPVTGLALTRAGTRLVAAAGRRLASFDAPSLRPLGSVDVRGEATSVAVSGQGRLAAAVLRGGRVAVVDLAAGRLLRRVKVAGAAAVAFDGAARL